MAAIESIAAIDNGQGCIETQEPDVRQPFRNTLAKHAKDANDKRLRVMRRPQSDLGGLGVLGERILIRIRGCFVVTGRENAP
jgi:hypothetical protein